MRVKLSAARRRNFRFCSLGFSKNRGELHATLYFILMLSPYKTESKIWTKSPTDLPAIILLVTKSTWPSWPMFTRHGVWICAGSWVVIRGTTLKKQNRWCLKTHFVCFECISFIHLILQRVFVHCFFYASPSVTGPEGLVPWGSAPHHGTHTLMTMTV